LKFIPKGTWIKRCGNRMKVDLKESKGSSNSKLSWISTKEFEQGIGKSKYWNALMVFKETMARGANALVACTYSLACPTRLCLSQCVGGGTKLKLERHLKKEC
jgi:hypothetical protein